LKTFWVKVRGGVLGKSSKGSLTCDPYHHHHRVPLIFIYLFIRGDIAVYKGREQQPSGGGFPWPETRTKNRPAIFWRVICNNPLVLFS
jgi:hypothetical protein